MAAGLRRSSLGNNSFDALIQSTSSWMMQRMSCICCRYSIELRSWLGHAVRGVTDQVVHTATRRVQRVAQVSVTRRKHVGSSTCESSARPFDSRWRLTIARAWPLVSSLTSAMLLGLCLLAGSFSHSRTVPPLRPRRDEYTAANSLALQDSGQFRHRCVGVRDAGEVARPFLMFEERGDARIASALRWSTSRFQISTSSNCFESAQRM